MTATESSPLLRRLAIHLARPVAAEDRRRAARHLLYWTGAAAYAAAGEWGEMLWQACGPAAAAGETIADDHDGAHFQYEASLGSLYELDDTHRTALVHPGPIVMPAARYVARLTKADQPALHAAIVRGYEAMIRLGLAVGPAHYALWHNTATCGNIGAAAAAASLLGLDVEQTTHALALAVTRAAGLWQIRLEPSDGKPWHTSQAAQTGVQAAWMARAGLRGPAHALEGEKGFFAAMCADARPAALLEEHAATWCMRETSLKPWPACRHAHPAIACALKLRARLAFAGCSPGRLAAGIRDIHIATYDDARAFCDRQHPADVQQARFSLQHGVAAALLWGEPWFPAFEAPARNDESCSRLRSRINIATDPACQGRYPAHFGARVEINLHDGTPFVAQTVDAPGDPELPFSDGDVQRLVARMLGDAGWTDVMWDRGLTPLRTSHLARCLKAPGAARLAVPHI